MFPQYAFSNSFAMQFTTYKTTCKPALPAHVYLIKHLGAVDDDSENTNKTFIILSSNVKQHFQRLLAFM